MKTCTTCKKQLADTDFNKNKARKDGLNNICKTCSRERSKQYYRENTEKHKQDIGIRKQKRKKENTTKILQILSGGCTNCQEDDIRTLDFHHFSEKKKSVMVMLHEGYNWETIKNEINKCVVLCSNCHRKLTSEQGNFWHNKHL